MQRRMLHSHRDLYVRGRRQEEDFSRMEIAEYLRTFGIRALGQHGALLPAVRQNIIPSRPNTRRSQIRNQVIDVTLAYSQFLASLIRAWFTIACENVYAQSMLVEGGFWLPGRLHYPV
jgi:hypothetical protein